MKKVHLSIPGKTFLAGEYLALTGGPAFILCTGPRFELIVSQEPSDKNPFHPESPAGRLYALNSQRLSSCTLKWKDPYMVKGGFGASSAQFGLLSGMLQLGDELWGESERFFDWHAMLAQYREISGKDKNGVPTGSVPSGADLVGAVGGGITYFDRNRGHTQTFSWPFQELDFYLFHTGQKIATHEHLKKLKIFETQKFHMATNLVLKGLQLVDSQLFIEGVRNFRDELWRQKWITEKSQSSVLSLEQLKSVLVAKGCGAMGSDVILVIGTKDGEREIKERAQELDLIFVAGTADLSKGLQVNASAFEGGSAWL